MDEDQELHFKFRSFLLQLGKDLSSTDFRHLKYILKPYVSSAQFDELPFCPYFDELQRRCNLGPTNFSLLKRGLREIGRQDLVDKIEQREQYFAEFPGQNGGLNLGAQEIDAVSDGTKTGRSGKCTPELQNELLQISGSNEGEINIKEISDVLPPCDSYDDVTEEERRKKMKKGKDLPMKKEELPQEPPNIARDPEVGNGEISFPQHLDNTENMEVSLSEGVELGSSEQATSVAAAKGHVMESNTTEPELAGIEKKTCSKTLQKEPCEDEVLDCNELGNLNAGSEAPVNDKMADTFKGSTGLPGAPLLYLDSDVVPDCKEDGDENGEESKVDEEKPYSEAAEHQSPEDDHGPGARPKEKTTKTAVPAETTKGKAMELDDIVTEANPHGSLFPANNPGDHGMLPPETKNSKEPTEGTYSNPTSPTVGTLRPDGDSDTELYFDKESTGLSKEKPKFSPHCPPHGANASMGRPPQCHHPPGVFSTPSSDYGASMYSGHAAPSAGNFSAAELMGIASAMGLPPSSPELTLQKQVALMNELLGLQGSISGAQFASSASTVPQSQLYMSTSQSASMADSPLESNCYSKAGYSVVVTNGQLSESTRDKGVVLMESGTQFCIALGNDNDHAAEVDITFGGMYLGVWVLEAKQSLASPLIIEGSSWAEGRLRFFSASDEKIPKPNTQFYGEAPELNGLIELEFKPEVPVLRLYAQHVREQNKRENLVEILLTDPKTATVGDLKQEISRRWKTGISCLLKGGKVLQEEKTIRSYALNKDEVIQVVNAKEELKIESMGKDPIIMIVDPCKVSVEAVQEFISENIKIKEHLQILRFKGKDIEVDPESLSNLFLTSKEPPVLVVKADRNINIDVLLPDGRQEEVEIMWSATVDDLKEELEERGICDSIATLKLEETGRHQLEITGNGGRKLFDLGLKNKSKIIVQVNAPQHGSTHRGFSTSTFPGGQTRGFGCFRGLDDHFRPMSNYRGSPYGTRAGGSLTDAVRHDYAADHDEDGFALLCGNEQNVYNQFHEDELNRKFSKEMAVTLTIQLKAKSTSAAGAAASSQPYMPSGAHCSGPTGPMSTPYPPPVPE